VVGPGAQNAGTLRVQGGASLTIGGGSLTIAGPSEIQGALTLAGGTLTGTGNVTVSGVLTWTGGAMSGGAITSADGGISLSGASVKDLNGRTLNNPATATWSGTGAFRVGGGSVVHNTGTWDCQNDASIAYLGGPLPTFDNSGTFKKSSGAGTTTVAIRIDNTGTVQAQTGTINLTGGGTHTGSFDGSAGTIQFGANTHELNAGTSLSGSTQLAGGTLNVNSAVAATTFTHSAGTLQGAASFTTSDLYTWTGGAMFGSGVTSADGGISLGGASVKDLNGRTLNNPATATWSGTGSFRVGSGSVVDNTGTWDCQSDAIISFLGGAAPTFNNSGTFRKSAGAGTTTVGIHFGNSGTVDVQSGTLDVSNASYTQTAGLTKLTGGSISSTTNINIQGGLLGGSGTVTGPVVVSGTGALSPGLSPGTLNLAGNYTQQAPNGAFDVEIGGTTPGSQFDRADVSGSGRVATLAGLLDISLIDGFTPSSGDSFTIMTYPSHTGAFTLNPPAAACVGWRVDHGSTAVVLTAFDVPREITGLTLLADRTSLVWDPAPEHPATVYDVLRGGLDALPVGLGPGEACVAQGITATTTTDPDLPAAGRGFWYVVRERVAGCGTGTYGQATEGSERIGTACP
jgi:hypothetical protein